MQPTTQARKPIAEPFITLAAQPLLGLLRWGIMLCPPFTPLSLLKCESAGEVEHTILVLLMEFVCTANQWPHVQTNMITRQIFEHTERL